MRLWSIGFIAIALFAVVVAFADDHKAMDVARVALGVVLCLFVVWLLWDRFNQDGQQD